MTTPNAGEDKEETGSLLHWCLAYKIIQILWKRIWQFLIKLMVLAVKNPPANAENLRDLDLIPGSGRSSGEGSGNPLQYSCLENPMDRGAWRATFHRVTQSRTWLKQLSTQAKHMLTMQSSHHIPGQISQNKHFLRF